MVEKLSFFFFKVWIQEIQNDLTVGGNFRWKMSMDGKQSLRKFTLNEIHTPEKTTLHRTIIRRKTTLFEENSSGNNMT